MEILVSVLSAIIDESHLKTTKLPLNEESCCKGIYSIFAHIGGRCEQISSRKAK